jgi:tRNA G18 (ribose-2'-O)-methylase SpoU
MNEIIGVGPHPRPWPTGPQYDPALLEQGDRRNVIDVYRYWTVEAIKADLEVSRAVVHIAIENWQHDMNIGTIVRNGNAFNVGGVHIIGKRHWNKRGAMVTDRYLSVEHHQTVTDFVVRMKQLGKTIIAVDNLPGAVNLAEQQLPKDCVLVFGGEGPGLSDDMVQASERMVMIQQTGSTRSVNVGVASGIVLYQWVQQHALKR